MVKRGTDEDSVVSSGSPLKKIVAWIKTHKRFVVVGSVLFVTIIIIAASVGGGGNGDSQSLKGSSMKSVSSPSSPTPLLTSAPTLAPSVSNYPTNQIHHIHTLTLTYDAPHVVKLPSFTQHSPPIMIQMSPNRHIKLQSLTHPYPRQAQTQTYPI